jgi:hypothetical protein
VTLDAVRAGRRPGRRASVPDGRRARLLALLAERAAARGTPVSAADACEVAVAAAGMDGGWLSVLSDPARRALVHATSRQAAELDELQFTLGEGPCVDAFESGSPVLVADLGAPGWGERWPGFTMTGAKAEAAAVFVFPLAMGAIRLGVLGLYRKTAGSLSAGALADVLVCADIALQLLLNSRAGFGGAGSAGTGVDGNVVDGNVVDGNGVDGNGFDGTGVDGNGVDGTGVDGNGFDGNGFDGNGVDRLIDGWSDDHAGVYQATGMVSAQRGVGLEQALALLRAHAFSHDRTLHEVAAAVVARRLRLDSDEAGEPAG